MNVSLAGRLAFAGLYAGLGSIRPAATQPLNGWAFSMDGAPATGQICWDGYMASLPPVSKGLLHSAGYDFFSC